MRWREHPAQRASTRLRIGEGLDLCGIAGKIYYAAEQSVEREILAAMSRSLARRGPDDGSYVQGNVGLIMRRLPVIDLAGGRLPFYNEDRTVWAALRRDL